jgi:hypothetical protein
MRDGPAALSPTLGDVDLQRGTSSRIWHKLRERHHERYGDTQSFCLSTAETAFTKVGQHEHKRCEKNKRRIARCGYCELRDVCERADRYERAGRCNRAKNDSLDATASTQGGSFDHY